MISHRTRQCGCHSPRKSKRHAVSSLCHVCVLHRPVADVRKRIVLAHLGSYSPNVTATERMTATRKKVSKRLDPVLEISIVTRWCHDPMKNGAGDTACRDILGTLICYRTNMIWRPVFGCWHIRQKFNFQPDRMQTAVHLAEEPTHVHLPAMLSR